MAVEDHEKYPEWRRAHDALQAAQDRYDEAVRLGHLEAEINIARRERDRAQAAYDRIAREID